MAYHISAKWSCIHTIEYNVVLHSPNTLCAQILLSEVDISLYLCLAKIHFHPHSNALSLHCTISIVVSNFTSLETNPTVKKSLIFWGP